VLPIGLLDGVSPLTLIFLGTIAVLLFGEKLPEVARAFGKKFADFRKNVRSIQDEIRTAAMSATSEVSSALDLSNSSSSSSASGTSNGSGQKRRSRASDEDYEEATAPKFVPPPSVSSVSPSDPGSTIG
jgi:Sec-independent protein translocase protein TatA